MSTGRAAGMNTVRHSMCCAALESHKLSMHAWSLRSAGCCRRTSEHRAYLGHIQSQQLGCRSSLSRRLLWQQPRLTHRSSTTTVCCLRVETQWGRECRYAQTQHGQRKDRVVMVPAHTHSSGIPATVLSVRGRSQRIRNMRQAVAIARTFWGARDVEASDPA